MKVFQYSDNYTSLQTLFLQLQLTLELSQIQEIISNYSDLLLFFAKYSFLFLEKTKVYESKKNNDSWLPSGQNSRVMVTNHLNTIPTNKDWSEKGNSVRKRNNKFDSIPGDLSTVFDSLSGYFNKLGKKTHGIVKTINKDGFTEFYQTVENYEALEKAGKLSTISKALFGISCLFATYDVIQTGIDSGDNSDIAMKHRFVRDATTIGVTYLASIVGYEFGRRSCGVLGSTIGTAVAPGAGTVTGEIVGEAVGGYVGSVVVSYGAEHLCDFIFEEKLGW